MTFKSSIDWPELPDNLPTYDGVDPGMSSVRSELQRLDGQHGVRSSEWEDVDGTAYRLKTRNGFPEIVATRKPSGIPEDVTTGKRGFVAHIVNAAKSALFSPYDLSVLEPGYTIHQHTYTVLPFATTYNVPSSDMTHWNDTLSFYKGKVLINGLEMKALGISGTPEKAIPWLIQRSGTGLAQYGDKIQNDTEKRVFSVERERVHSWMPGSVDAVLNNPSARPDKALLCGALIDSSTHSARLMQLAFTGATWDSLSGGWAVTTAQVSMLLTPPYLTKIDAGISAEQSLCIPESTGTSTGSDEVAQTFPPCQIGLHGTGYAHQSLNLDYVRFYYDSAWVESLQGYERTSFTRSNYTKTTGGSVEVGDVTVTVSASNSYYNSANISQKGLHEQYWTAPGSYGAGDMSITDISPEPIFADPWGTNWWGVEEDTFSGAPYYPASNVATWQSHRTTGEFSIDADGYELVRGEFSRYVIHEGGLQANLSAHNWAIEPPYLQPGVYTNSDYFGPEFQIDLYLEDDARLDIARERMHQFSGKYNGVRSFSQGGVALGNDGNLGNREMKKYEVSLVSRDMADDRVLNWSTKDFLLHDPKNGCFISVDSTFAGSQSYGKNGSAQLTVVLTVTTPFGTANQTLFETSISYSDLLPEQELEYGFTYVPNPQLRIMFAPLFRGQGDFKGAAYTTADEHEKGATSACLFNFVLTLSTYHSIGADTSTYPTISFVPCNLLEMLYAYVYSSKYGVDDYERYPIDNAARYNAFQNSLFSAQWRVNYRDGVFVDWLDTLGNAYITETMTELYRT